MSIEFWKNGAVEEPPSNPTYLPTANRRFHVPMKKIGKNQEEFDHLGRTTSPCE